MKLIVTIDTEEDNWGQYGLANHTLQNIEKINLLQDLFDRYEIKPTYLITYPVATNKNAIDLLRRIMEDDRCEIGTHCHPWNNPPFEEERNNLNSMICNIPPELQYKKIATLHQKITYNFGVIPTSFRAGRWGYGEDIPRILDRLGYRVDSSMIAFENWEGEGGSDFSTLPPIVFNWGHQEDLSSGLLEVPATAGYSQKNFDLSNRVWLKLGGKFIKKLRIRGILDRLQLLNKIWLSPETASASEMIKLTNSLRHQGCKIINMFFHSTALKAGLSPFVKTKEDEALFLKRIEEYLVYARTTGIDSIKLSDVPDHVNKSEINSLPY